eukprot:TRINITY_DN7073_c3_g1_i1.p1 TRINITY_DN7073_c3_g1~~TRINITY_DN7073_c3_g1_i1.p1  ORF type:complete len:400 (-),score=41.78 TRINITY_DN7073_c3_g1_i1:46-1245(-)
MRLQNWTGHTLEATRDHWRADKTEPACLRDQSLINNLHFRREEFGYPGPSPVMVLPCHWSVFPTTEWQPNWNSPETWLKEVQDRRIYPGLVSVDQVEVFCPDEGDMLSAWAFIPISIDSESRQTRLRQFAHYEGRKRHRYCSRQYVPSTCCKCGEAASIMHVAGDLKNWPSMQSVLMVYLPPWKDPPKMESFTSSSSRGWWGSDNRAKRMRDGTEHDALLVAKQQGLIAHFDRCTTLVSKGHDNVALVYHHAALKYTRLPLTIEVETSANRDAYLMIGINGKSGLEMVVGLNNEEETCLRWVNSKDKDASGPAWSTRGNLICSASSPHIEQVTDVSGTWTKWSIRLEPDGQFEVGHGDKQWGSWMIEAHMLLMRDKNLVIQVGSLTGKDEKWAVCSKIP